MILIIFSIFFNKLSKITNFSNLDFFENQNFIKEKKNGKFLEFSIDGKNAENFELNLFLENKKKKKCFLNSKNKKCDFSTFEIFKKNGKFSQIIKIEKNQNLNFSIFLTEKKKIFKKKKKKNFKN